MLLSRMPLVRIICSFRCNCCNRATLPFGRSKAARFIHIPPAVIVLIACCSMPRTPMFGEGGTARSHASLHLFLSMHSLHLFITRVHCVGSLKAPTVIYTQPTHTSCTATAQDRQEKRTLGLVILRGETIVTLSVESPPPQHTEKVKLSAIAPGAGVARPAGRGMPIAPQTGMGVGLMGPVSGGMCFFRLFHCSTKAVIPLDPRAVVGC